MHEAKNIHYKDVDDEEEGRKMGIMKKRKTWGENEDEAEGRRWDFGSENDDKEEK